MMGTLRSIYFLALSVTLAFGKTQVAQVKVTPTQALVEVKTDQPGNCVYRISESSTLSPLVNDVNTALFPGANSDARAGSVIRDTDHRFVAGTRTAAQGGDGKWYSRALAANTAHYGGVTCGADSEVSFTFTTENIPLGATYTEPLPFNSAALGNYALPTIDFTNLAKQYIDPRTGFKYRYLTGPGQMPESAQTLFGALGSGASNGNVAGEASGANWTTPSNGLTVDGAFASYTASGQDILTLRLASSCAFGQCAGYNWSAILGSGSGFPTGGIDAYQLALTGNGGGSVTQIDVALSWNGVSQGSEWETITLPASTGMVTYPSTLAPGFPAWQGPNFPVVPAIYWQVLQQTYPVNTSGTGVTSTGSTFSLDSRILTAGSKITIAGVEYTIASVDSATHLTLTGSAGTQTAATAYIANFSVLVRKHSATAGTVNIDGATVTLPFSNTFGNGGSGFQTFCSHLSGKDSSGRNGRFCIFQSEQGTSGIYWVADDLTVRYIGDAFVPTSSIGVAADEYNQLFYNGQSLFDTTDPNSWWTSPSLISSGHVTLVKATYNPAGVAGCAVAANYQAVSPNATYDPHSVDNCNITYSELTRPSQGKDIVSQLPSSLTTGKFGTSGPTLIFVQNNYAVMSMNSGSQDSESWLVTVNLTTGAIKGTYSTYMNQGVASCRACVLHGTGPSSPTDDWFYLIFNIYPGGSATGQGPYNLTVSSPLTSTPSNASCAGVVDPRVTWLIPYSNGCDNITLTGSDNIPCDPNPSAFEVANAPACSWHSGWTQWQAGAVKVGDWIQDPGTGGELMVVAAQTGGTSWTVIRNVNPPQGPEMVQSSAVTPALLRNHSSGWTASMYCTFHQNAFAQVSAEVDGSGLIWDRKFFGFNHAVLRKAGIISAEFYTDINDNGESVRIGSFPGAANTPETARIRNSASFSGKTGLGGFNLVQSHIGWDGNPVSFTDMAPMAPSSGGNFTLWAQPGVTNISGSLYKIPAANAYIPHDKRRAPTAVWSGMFNFLDISGTGPITGNASDNYHYCLIDYTGATCGQTGESVGDVFLNIPQASIDGVAGGAFDFNRANAVPLGQEPLAVLQYYFTHVTRQTNENLGRWERRITTGGGRYNGQDTYSNSKLIFNSNLLLFNCAAPNLQRAQDICVGPMLPDPPLDPVLRNDFFAYPVQFDSTAKYAEVQFGYAENGAAEQFYCTSRQEACNTSSPAGAPFNWEGETRTLTNCSQGCTISVQAIPDHVVYFRKRWSNDGVTWNTGPVRVEVVP